MSDAIAMEEAGLLTHEKRVCLIFSFQAKNVSYFIKPDHFISESFVI